MDHSIIVELSDVHRHVFRLMSKASSQVSNQNPTRLELLGAAVTSVFQIRQTIGVMLSAKVVLPGWSQRSHNSHAAFHLRCLEASVGSVLSLAS